MNKILQIMGMLKNSGNPMAMLTQMAGNDPKVAQALRMTQNNDPKQVALNLAKENGINAEQLSQLAADFGIKL